MAPLLRLSVVFALALVAIAIPAPPQPERDATAQLRLLQSTAVPLSGTLHRRSAIIKGSLAKRLSSSQIFARSSSSTRASSPVSAIRLNKLYRSATFGVHKALDKSAMFKRSRKVQFARGTLALQKANVASYGQGSEGHFLKLKGSASRDADRQKYLHDNVFPVARERVGKVALFRAILNYIHGNAGKPLSKPTPVNHINVAKITRLLGARHDTSLYTISRAGVTADTCTSDSSCYSGYGCKSLTEGTVGCPAGSNDCVCLPTDGVRFCTSSDDCTVPGEVCVDAGSDNGPFCASEAVAIAEGLPIIGGSGSGESGGSPEPGDEEEDTGSGDAGGGGVTADTCTSDSSCYSGYGCKSLTEGTVGCPAGSNDCVCLPTDGVRFCTSSDDCTVPGEVCVDAGSDNGPFCASEAVAIAEGLPIIDDPSGGDTGSGSTGSDSEGGEGTGSAGGDSESPSGGGSPNAEGINFAPLEEEGGKCIDARALRHLSREDLVFRKHTLSNVLCDENESCATPGHMVMFHGRTMRMVTYCGVVGCTKRVMEVNSPRYSRGLRVGSNTKWFHFTAFAARYNTRIEEAVMAAAVRAGL